MNNEIKNKGLRVIPLSGAETIGLNCYVVEYNDDIFVVDYGVTFPDGETYGIEYILPPLAYLLENKHRIKAIIMTHAHLDHVGGIPFVLDKLGYPPIYGSPFAVEFVKDKLAEARKDKQAKLYTVAKDDILKFGDVQISFFHVTHSIPQAYGVCFHTPEGRVVYTGDYKLDETPINDIPTEMGKIKELGRKGVLVALLDSTNAFEKGKSNSELYIRDVLEEQIRKAPGRVIVATFSSLVTRQSGLIDVAKKLNKKVFVSGRSLESNIKIAMRIGYIHPQANVMLGRNDLDKHPDNKLLILSTGSQGEEFASLTRIAKGTHKTISLKKTDTVIMSSSVIPTKVMEVQNLMDAIARRGVRIINTRLMDVHSSGHPNQEDMKEMALALNAKYNIPVHGFTSFAAQHRQVLKEAGINESSVFIPVEGQVFAFENGIIKHEKKVAADPIYAVGDMILEDGAQIIAERKALAKDGIVVVSLVLEKGKVTKVSTVVKGIDAEDKQKSVLAEIKQRIAGLRGKVSDEKAVKKEIYARVGAFFHKVLRRYPIIIVDVAHE